MFSLTGKGNSPKFALPNKIWKMWTKNWEKISKPIDLSNKQNFGKDIKDLNSMINKIQINYM